jgi:hypothetical protein
MSITRLLLLAGLLAIGACHPGPTALCDRDLDGDTQESSCTSDLGTPGSPDANLSAARVQR